MPTITTAMILAAGRGERMRPLTDSLPKPLLKVAGKPLIVHHLEKLVAAGIKKVVINHAWLGEKIVDELGDGKYWGLEIVYSPEAPVLETAGGIVNALSQLGDGSFIVVNGDVWSEYDYTALVGAEMEKDAHLVLVNNPSHNKAGDFYLQDSGLLAASLCGGYRAKRYTFSGIAIYRATFFQGIEVEPLPLAPILKRAMASGAVSGELFAGNWCDVGTPARLKQLNEELR